MIIPFHPKLDKFYCRQALLTKVKYHNGGKEEAAKYYLKNRGFKRKSKSKYRNLSEEEKQKKNMEKIGTKI